MLSPQKKVLTLWSLLPLLFLYVCPIQAQKDKHHHHHHDHSNKEDKFHGMVLDSNYIEFLMEQRSVSDEPVPERYGAWNTVIPEQEGAALGRILGIQAVHSVLLPSGKVLMSSGSSWRNYKDVETYPEYDDPAGGIGLFNMYDDPFRNSKSLENVNLRKQAYYNLVNTTAIYDPLDNSFYRIPHPIPVDDPQDTTRFIPSDLFCSGHLHLPNGNPLFVGGTQYYFPYRTGTKSTYIFDWQKELKIDWQSVDWRQMPEENDEAYPWVFSGLMERGRWYPSIVPLLDGRFVIMGGYVGFDKPYEEMYRFEMNSMIEFFDPYKFDQKDWKKAWKMVDVKKTARGPFTTKLDYEFEPTPCVDINFHDDWESQSQDNDFPLVCDCNERCLEDNQYDAFKLYPNAYLTKENQIYFTREGDWVSLRTVDAAYMRKTKKTYFMNIGGDADKPTISFRAGPERKDEVTSYGTSYIDPNTKHMTILGGQPTSAGTLMPLNAENPTHFAGGRGSRKREQFWFDENKWTQENNFLGNEIEADRTMLTAIILPTKQVLLINGGNYDFYGAVLYPILLTPIYNERGQFQKYTKERMNPAVEPRLYHNTALLLPNGKIWVAGGNSARASVEKKFPNIRENNRIGQPKPNLDLVDIDLYFFRDGQMAKAQKGMQSTPTENWTAEIFSPPYIYIDKGRTSSIVNMTPIQKNPAITFKKEIEEKTFYLIQGEQQYHIVLADLPQEAGKKKAELVLIKLPSFTHNWDNGQFFVQLDIQRQAGNQLVFKTPNMKEGLIPPGYYMLYYIDTKGKPSLAQMVRFDDKATAP